jgi:segregation and condensation protein B
MNDSARIIALLFTRAEPWSFEELRKALGLDTDTLAHALEELPRVLDSTGLVLCQSHEGYSLGTNPELSALFEKIQKEELEKPLSKASVETLTIILYGTDVTRGRIDYIRGVNSSFILRALLIRGMIERLPQGASTKRFIYVPTTDLLNQLGVARKEDLPDYATISEKINHSMAAASSEEE